MKRYLYHMSDKLFDRFNPLLNKKYVQDLGSGQIPGTYFTAFNKRNNNTDAEYMMLVGNRYASRNDRSYLYRCTIDDSKHRCLSSSKFTLTADELLLFGNKVGTDKLIADYKIKNDADFIRTLVRIGIDFKKIYDILSKFAFGVFGRNDVCDCVIFQSQMLRIDSISEVIKGKII